MGPVCCTPLLGDCDFNEIRCGGERQRRRQLDGAAPTLRYFASWVARRAVGGVAEEGWQGTLAHWVQRLCAVLATQEQFGGS